MRPALTKPMSATVMALEDWAMAVVRKPVAIPRSGVAVDFSSRRLIVWPVPVFRPSVIMAMPSRRRARPPRLLMRTEIVKTSNARAFGWQCHVCCNCDGYRAIVSRKPRVLEFTYVKFGKRLARKEALPPLILYGGEGDFERDGCRVLGWREFSDGGARPIITGFF